MIATLIRAPDRVLGDVLESLLGHLQGHSHGRFRALREAGPRRDAEENRVRPSAETISPVLPLIGPGSAEVVAKLDQEHRLLGLYVRYLTTQLRNPNGERDFAVARWCLTIQLNHVFLERDGVGRWAHAAELAGVGRLKALIERCTPLGGLKSGWRSGSDGAPAGEDIIASREGVGTCSRRF